MVFNDDIIIDSIITPGKNKIIDKALKGIFSKIGHCITLNTKLCYHYELDDYRIIIPFEINFLEKGKDRTKIAVDKVNELVRYLENMDLNKIWNTKDKYYLNIIRHFYGQKDFIRVQYQERIEIISLPFYKINKIEAYEKKMPDGTVIKQIVSPFMSDYGIYIDHSKKFEDFSIDYNVLHLFEHLAVPWKEQEEYIYMNGFTTVVGICICSVITSTLKSCTRALNEYIDWHNDFRKNIDKYKKKIELEAVRANYETIDRNSITAFGKSFSSIYKRDYRMDILKYYASLPFTIILVVPQRIDWKLVKDLKPCEKVKRPSPTEISRIPLTYFESKMTDSYTILPISEAKRFDKIRVASYEEETPAPFMSDQEYTGNYIEGVDCILVPIEFIDIRDSNTLIRQISKTPISEIPEFLITHPLPLKNYGLYVLDRNISNMAVYLMED